MICEEMLEGRYVVLKSCTIDDAEFTLAIRQNPKFTSFLPKIEQTLEQQKEWIRQQREKAGDYFFVVWDKKGNRIGTVGLCEIAKGQYESNRLTMLGDSFEATEAVLLLFQFGFKILNLDHIGSFIFADNKRAIRFNKMFGGIISEPYPNTNNEVKNSYGRMIVRCKFLRENFPLIEKKITISLYS